MLASHPEPNIGSCGHDRLYGWVPSWRSIEVEELREICQGLQRLSPEFCLRESASVASGTMNDEGQIPQVYGTGHLGESGGFAP